MKPVISNLTDALAYVLDQLYSAEELLQTAIPECREYITSQALREELDAYANRVNDKRSKLDRIFSYLMREPGSQKNQIVASFIENTKQVLQLAITPEMRDLMLATCFQSVNYYKIASYLAAARFASELELEIPSSLIQEIMEWEKETDKHLVRMATYELSTKSPEYHANRSESC